MLSSRRLVSLSLGSELIRACPSSGSSFAFVGRDFPGNFTVTVPIRPRPRSALYGLLESVCLPQSKTQQDTHTNTEREREKDSERANYYFHLIDGFAAVVINLCYATALPPLALFTTIRDSGLQLLIGKIYNCFGEESRSRNKPWFRNLTPQSKQLSQEKAQTTYKQTYITVYHDNFGPSSPISFKLGNQVHIIFN